MLFRKIKKLEKLNSDTQGPKEHREQKKIQENRNEIMKHDHQGNGTELEDQSTDISEKDKSLLGYVNEFFRKDELLDSEGEHVVYSVLKTFINEKYIILPHVHFREIFETKENYWKIKNRVAHMHYDFVIYNEEFFPVLFIEINGKKHEGKKQEIIDEFKKAVLKKNGMKLVTINLVTSMSDTEIREEVIHGIKRDVPSRNDYPVYCPECKSFMKVKRNKKIGSYFYGCSKFQSSGCRGKRNITDVPALYNNIPIE